jgi:membrane fusion protein (multidrug efflux system)
MATDAGRKVLIAVTMACAVSVACEKPAPPPPPKPPEVYVTPVVAKDVPVYLELVGQTVGYQDVEIRARVEGFLETMDFREGSFVHKGALLYTIDRKPLEALVSAAKAEQANAVAAQANAVADQATAQARLEKADNDVKRYKPLAAKQAVSQQELDNAVALQDAARSQVEAAKAAVEGAKAAVEKAKAEGEKAALDLGYTRVYSPIDGLAGTTLVKPGNLVGRGQNTLLTTVSQIDPILFRVGVTEADYLRIVKRDPSRVGAEPRASGIELRLADGSVYPQQGTLGTVDRAVDPTTGTLGAQFVFPNPEQVLRPGQFGRARVLIDRKEGALLVPQRAVQELQNLRSVAVVGADNKVAFRNVKTGLRVGQLWVVEDGLKQGEQVVVEGLQRIQDGVTVTPS